YAAYKMAFGGDEQLDLEDNIIMKFVSRKFNILTKYNGRTFFVKHEKKVFLTPLFLTLLLIESADIVFAVDSIPAVIAITKDPFIIITSNIFAILGLRALYFALAGIVDIFTYLKYGVGVILAYVGLKMILSDIYPIPTEYSLIFIILCLVVSVVLSLMIKRNEVKKEEN
ncbi:MAG: TerC family protein, partial [Clostridiales bacterium]